MHPTPDPWSAPLRARPTDPALRAETLRGADAVRRIEAEWRALDAQAAACPADLGLCRQAATDVRPDGTRLVTLRRDGQLVGLWPLHRGRVGPLRVVQRLARGLQALDGPTLARGVDPDAACVALWAEVASWSDVDVVQLGAVEADHPLARVPAIARASRESARTCTVDLRTLGDAAAVVAAQSKSRRSNLRRRRRKLAAFGAVRFEVLTEPAPRRAAMTALLDQKSDWLDAQEAVSPTFRAPWFRRGLEAAAGDPDATHLLLFALRVGERTVAWEAGLRDGSTYRSFLAAYDPDLADLGPGVALQTEVMGWCGGQGLRTYDLLAPVTPFKEQWATDRPAIQTAVVPLRRRGEVLVPLVRDGRASLKELLGRLPPGARSVAFQVTRARQALHGTLSGRASSSSSGRRPPR